MRSARALGGSLNYDFARHEWFSGGACDGFVLAATHLPGAFEEFVRMVVPILRARGVFRSEYTGNTLRDHLGLARPANPARAQSGQVQPAQVQPALARPVSA